MVSIEITKDNGVRGAAVKKETEIRGVLRGARVHRRDVEVN